MWATTKIKILNYDGTDLRMCILMDTYKLKLIKKKRCHLLQIKRRRLQMSFSNVSLNFNWKNQSNADNHVNGFTMNVANS